MNGVELHFKTWVMGQKDNFPPSPILVCVCAWVCMCVLYYSSHSPPSPPNFKHYIQLKACWILLLESAWLEAVLANT